MFKEKRPKNEAGSDIPDKGSGADMLAPWTYRSEELTALELEALFLSDWLLAGHVSEIPNSGDYTTFNIGGERAVLIRDEEGRIGAFHNVCRHRGSRVVGADRGHCRRTMVCPFHGWTYHLDGRLKQVPSPGTFDQLEIGSNGLIRIELEIWHGFLFIRFRSGGQSLAERLAAVEEKVTHYRLSELLPLGSRSVVELPYNWKLIHDVDNEGYHVPTAHPSLHSLYGRDYRDALMGNVPISVARVDNDVSPFWSVDYYKKLLPSFDHLPQSEQRVWFYFAVFPNLVFVLYPEMVEFYMTVPVSAGKSLVIGQCFGLQDSRRETRAVRYLNQRINERTVREDENLALWLQESFASSVYPRDNLSTLEFGVAYFHQQLKVKLPVLDLEMAPQIGHLAVLNQKMLNNA